MEWFSATLIVKGRMMHTHAQVLQHLKGIALRFRQVSETGTIDNMFYVLEFQEEDRERVNRRLNEWIVEDSHLNGPYPNGSLLFHNVSTQAYVNYCA